MNQDNSKKPFLPRNKPKSWVIMLCDILSCLVVAGPLIFLGSTLEIKVIATFGVTLFKGCWFVSAAMAFVDVPRFLAGHYKNIEDRDWADQVW